MKNKCFLFFITLFLILLSCKSQQLASSVVGTFVGKGEGDSRLELILTSDNGFQYRENFGHGSDYTDGSWKIENDVLILNSRSLSKDEEAIQSISSGRWITLENSGWKFSRNKLVELGNKERRLTKVEK